MIIVLGVAVVRRGIEITILAPISLQLRVGQTLRLRYHYDLREASRERETYRFLLDSRWGRRHPPAILRHVEDRPGTTEAEAGALEQMYRFDRPGHFVVEFEVAAELIRSHWRTGEVHHWEDRTSSGRIRIDVQGRGG